MLELYYPLSHLVHYLSFSQTVKVIDGLNNPIPFVSIFDNLKKNGIITDKNGEADQTRIIPL